MRIKQFNNSNWHYLLIGLTGVITHGLILLNDGVYFDGWIILNFIKGKDWAGLSNQFQEGGGILAGYLHWFLGHFPNIIFGYHLVAFVCIVSSGLLIYQIARLSGFVSREESLLLSLISLTYPAFQVGFELIILPYVASYSIFFLAVLLALWAEKMKKPAHYGLRLSAIVCFLVSFSINSLLVFYFGFLVLLVMFVRRMQSLSLREMLPHFLLRHLDYVFLPFLYWVIKEIAFPRHGLYINYNRFTFSPFAWIISLASFLYNGIFNQFNAALRELLNLPALAFFGILGILGMIRYFRGAFIHQSAKPSALLGYGISLIGLGVFPYVVVGKMAGLTGWSTRHSLLLALPVALVIVAITRLLFSVPKAGLSRSGWILLTMLILGFGLTMASNYLDWQARWVKDRSLMVNLGKLDGANKYSVYWVNDQYLLGGESYYRFYEWSSLFKRVWGDETRIGFDQRHSTPKLLADYKPFFNKRYNLGGFDPAGQQATLSIRRGKAEYSTIELVARYFYYRFLRQKRLSDFLADVTQVQVQQLPPPLEQNYRQP